MKEKNAKNFDFLKNKNKQEDFCPNQVLNLNKFASSGIEIIKGTISDHTFKISLFFQTSRFFLHIQRELHCNKLTYLYNNSCGNILVVGN